MELRDTVICVVKQHYGLADENDTAYRLAGVETLADAILDIPEIKEALAVKAVRDSKVGYERQG